MSEPGFLEKFWDVIVKFLASVEKTLDMKIFSKEIKYFSKMETIVDKHEETKGWKEMVLKKVLKNHNLF